jgi:RNA polymerase sigma factor (sigma-70 family)
VTERATAAFAGGESAFAALTERYRRELHVHCYRMLASFDEAEDAVQETFLRAWRARDTFDGSSLVRAWLYKIATNVCLDAIRRSARRLSSMRSFAEVPWLTPYPDALLDEMAPGEDERALLASFIDAHERGDAPLAISIAARDLRITMPPKPYLFEGLDVIAPLMTNALGEGDWRLLPTMANRMPTAASYLRGPDDTVHRPFKFDVLRIVDGRIAEITTFGPELFQQFGLPTTL